MIFRRKITVFLSALVCCLLLSSCGHSNYSVTSSAECDFRQGNYALAFEKLWWPAHRCDPRAQYAIGYMYYYGLGTILDQDLARIWFRRSADAGFPAAIRAYARIVNPQFQPRVNFNTPATKPLRQSKLFGPNYKTSMMPPIPRPTIKYRTFGQFNEGLRMSK